MDSKDILEFGKSNIWHPYTSLTKSLPCYHVKSADGVRIKITEGSELTDGTSSWWGAVHGYNNSELNQVAHEQIDKMSHVMFGGLTHNPAVSLVSKLLKMTYPWLLFPCRLWICRC
jgi:adenosylmethionine-8-amino-7-oxononanoate aminotransferase